VSVALLIPSRGRPVQAARLARAVADTVTPGCTTTFFLLDHDDPLLADYQRYLAAAAPDLQLVITLPGGPRGMGPVLNRAAGLLCASHRYLAFMGDDHYPHTPGWDVALTRALGGRPGVAYGNDLFQSERLPTACVMDSVIVRVLGYMSPPPLVHLWIDDFWRTLGEALGNLAYLGHILIEHKHPDAGKAPRDSRYAATGCNPELMMADKGRWDTWRAGTWEGETGDRARLLDALDLGAAV
jgi:hypothetical protein